MHDFVQLRFSEPPQITLVETHMMVPAIAGPVCGPVESVIIGVAAMVCVLVFLPY
jgi:hypothetical protein